jgi:hypothetical protein
MSKAKKYGIVIGSLLLAFILIVLRHVIFQPLLFIGTLLSAFGETAAASSQNVISAIQARNATLLNDKTVAARQEKQRL